MSRRSAIIATVVALAAIGVHPILVGAMARGHVAHVLLGAGNAMPPLGATLLAVTLVLVRFFAIVGAPGLLLAAAVSFVAHALKGPVSPRAVTSDGAVVRGDVT